MATVPTFDADDKAIAPRLFCVVTVVDEHGEVLARAAVDGERASGRRTRRRPTVEEWRTALRQTSRDKLPGTGLLLAFVFAQFVHDKESAPEFGTASPSVPTLAEAANVSVRTIYNWMPRLCELGWLERLDDPQQRGRGHVNRYGIRYPAWFEDLPA